MSVAYLITPCRLEGLLLGSLVAVARRDKSILPLLRRWAEPIAVGAGCLLLGVFLGQRHFAENANGWPGSGTAVDSSVVLTFGLVAVAIFFAAGLAVVVDARPHHLLRRFFEAGWLRSIGRYSYGIYVFHALAIGAVVGFGRRYAPSFVDGPDEMTKPVLAVLTLVVSYAAAFISYHAFEKHFLRLKRYFAYRRNPGEENTTAV
jgi:peptidoglycan/LPS O-acetylase OafA/YrhL